MDLSHPQWHALLCITGASLSIVWVLLMLTVYRRNYRHLSVKFNDLYVACGVVSAVEGVGSICFAILVLTDNTNAASCVASAIWDQIFDETGVFLVCACFLCLILECNYVKISLTTYFSVVMVASAGCVVGMVVAHHFDKLSYSASLGWCWIDSRSDQYYMRLWIGVLWDFVNEALAVLAIIAVIRRNTAMNIGQHSVVFLRVSLMLINNTILVVGDIVVRLDPSASLPFAFLASFCLPGQGFLLAVGFFVTENLCAYYTTCRCCCRDEDDLKDASYMIRIKGFANDIKSLLQTDEGVLVGDPEYLQSMHRRSTLNEQSAFGLDQLHRHHSGSYT